MPKFPPNTGFKMPGIGSKEINSPSNFRDDQHVDKMGYCEDTPDEMLPLGSSPLKYTPIIDDDPYTSVRGYDMSGLGEAIAGSTKRKKKTKPSEDDQSANTSTDTSRERLTTIEKGGTKTTPGSDQGGTGVSYKKSFDNLPKGEDGKALPKGDFKGGTLSQWETYVRNFNKKKNTKTITTPDKTTDVYKVNGQIVDKAAYDAAAPSERSKEKK